MTDTPNRVGLPSRSTESLDSVARTDGRTDRTNEETNYDELSFSPNASRAGGLDEFGPLCACGCGKRPKPGRHYASGHRPVRSLRERMDAKIQKDPETGCWNWTGALAAGYGNVNLGKGKWGRVHRVIYERELGPIPEGLHLDHLCRNTKCCNPAHLEPVTADVNIKRGQSPMIVAHNNGVCMQGHSLAHHGCYRRGTNRVAYCRACRREKRAAR